LQLLPGLENPSFLTSARHRPVLYAVHGDREQVSAFAIAPDGRLSHLNTAPCGGRNPVHLATTPDDRFLLVANHLSSTVALLRLEAATGAIGAIADLLALPGEPGPHRIQQPFAKPHQVASIPKGVTCWCRTRAWTAPSRCASRPRAGGSNSWARSCIARAAGRGTSPSRPTGASPMC
jgi:6-phosphogluconolactonase (cycloisomerase 2 family)